MPRLGALQDRSARGEFALNQRALNAAIHIITTPRTARGAELSGERIARRDCDKVDRASESIAAEVSVLRSSQYLNALDVGGIDGVDARQI